MIDDLSHIVMLFHFYFIMHETDSHVLHSLAAPTIIGQPYVQCFISHKTANQDLF